MKKQLLFAATALALFATACKPEEAAPATDFQTLKKEVLADFTNNVALASYKDLNDAATALNNSVMALQATSNAANLTKAQADWKAMRSIWEKCEGFLFGPVDVNEYDPHMDTWPTDYAQMDSLLASPASLGVTEIAGAQLSLRGYHPMEYLLFGNHGNRQPSQLDARKMQYLVSLSADLKNTCQALYNDWSAAPTNYAQQLINAGTPASTEFPKYQDAYLALVSGMIDICEEVGEGKIKEPFDQRAPSIVESPYSGNSWKDFQDNLQGLENVYHGKYTADGKGLNDLIAARNKSLDAKIQNQINAAKGAFSGVTMRFEDAIMDAAQRSQVQKVMDALDNLKTTLETELKPFVIQYITN